MTKKFPRVLGWFIVVGWCILEIPFGIARQIEGAIEKPVTGVPYAMGAWGVLIFGIWLIRSRRFGSEEVTS